MKNGLVWDKNKADRLKSLLSRLAPGLSIRSIASSLEVDFSYLSKILRGEILPTDGLLALIARYFFLKPADLEDYFIDKITLDDLESRALIWKFENINFSSSECPAWRLVLQFSSEDLWLRENHRQFVQNICVFLALVNFQQGDPAYLSYLRDNVLSSFQGLSAWLSSLREPLFRRVVFHAFLFTVDPVQYATEKGLLYIDRALWFKEPDRHIRTPEFAFELIKKHAP